MRYAIGLAAAFALTGVCSACKTGSVDGGPDPDDPPITDISRTLRVYTDGEAIGFDETFRLASEMATQEQNFRLTGDGVKPLGTCAARTGEIKVTNAVFHDRASNIHVRGCAVIKASHLPDGAVTKPFSLSTEGSTFMGKP